MKVDNIHCEYRVDIGRSSQGAFVRIVHVPTNTSETVDPIRGRNKKEVIGELSQFITEKVQMMNAPFSLWRLDDNDNEFMIMKYWVAEEAESTRKMFEDRGHKQVYFIKKHE